MLPIVGPLLQLIGKPIIDIIDKSITDKDLANKLKNDLETTIVNNAQEIQTKAADIVLGEIKGESAAQRNWRPHLMYLIMGLLVFNGVIVPLVQAIFGVTLPVLEAWNAIPDQMWTLLQVGMGGYIAGRTLEKITPNIIGAINKKPVEGLPWRDK